MPSREGVGAGWGESREPDGMEEGGGGGRRKKRSCSLGKEGRIRWEIKETFGGGKEGGEEARKQVSNSDKMD